MKTLSMAAAAAILAVAGAGGAQAAIRSVSGTAVYPPAFYKNGPDADALANVLHSSPRAPTTATFSFKFDDADIDHPAPDEWRYVVSDMSLDVNGVHIGGSDNPFSGSIQLLTGSTIDRYLLVFYQTADSAPQIAGDEYFQFSFTFDVDAGTVVNGAVPSASAVTDHMHSVVSQFDYRGHTATNPNYSIIAFEGHDVTLSEGGVPEPATWAMMLLGFGGVGAVIRRRRVKPGLVVQA